MQLSSAEMALRETQKYFYSLDMDPYSFRPSVDDSVNMKKNKIEVGAEDSSFRDMVSTFDFENHVIREGILSDGKRIVTFGNILNHNKFPLSEILTLCLEMGAREIGKPVEIEFAVELNRPKGQPAVFNLLQIRPIVESKERVDVKIEKIAYEETILYSHAALGNGTVNDLHDIVYVKTATFDPSRNTETVSRIAALNDKFLADHKQYVLVGPGRWGSSDPWLGIPVKWPQIAAARLIVESGLENYRIDPSQGTHFFQNLTSFRVGYFTIHPYIKDGFFDVEYLDSLPAVYEDDLIRQVHFDDPLTMIINGRTNSGVLMRPQPKQKTKVKKGEIV
jgi:hypothetical protein